MHKYPKTHEFRKLKMRYLFQNSTIGCNIYTINTAKLVRFCADTIYSVDFVIMTIAQLIRSCYYSRAIKNENVSLWFWEGYLV